MQRAKANLPLGRPKQGSNHRKLKWDLRNQNWYEEEMTSAQNRTNAARVYPKPHVLVALSQMFLSRSALF